MEDGGASGSSGRALRRSSRLIAKQEVREPAPDQALEEGKAQVRQYRRRSMVCQTSAGRKRSRPQKDEKGVEFDNEVEDLEMSDKDSGQSNVASEGSKKLKGVDTGTDSTVPTSSESYGFDGAASSSSFQENHDINSSDKAKLKKAKNLEVARSRAAYYAHYHEEAAGPGRNNRRRQPQQQEQERQEPPKAPEPWPGPFSTARSIVEDRARAGESRNAARGAQAGTSKIIDWSPSRIPCDSKNKPISPQSLYSMCTEVLCQHIDYVESLECVPEPTKRCIVSRLQELGKVTFKAAKLILAGEMSEICLSDCSKMCEQELAEILAQCSLDKLEVLELGFCGRALSDKCISSLKLSQLRKLHLQGNYLLSDKGLLPLIQVAKGLTVVELVDCSNITESSIEALANYRGSQLQNLSLEGCSQLHGLKLLPSLMRMPQLRVLSLARVEDVTDQMVTELVVRIGSGLEEIYLSGCRLTDDAIAAIGACCSGVRTLHLDDLPLTDLGLARLAEGCRSVCNISVENCQFSDEALAAFITASGSSLRYASVSNVKQAGDNTLLALAKHSNGTLETLNASFCRDMTDDGFGFLADSCSHLTELQLFGCTQVSDKFVNCHSNESLRIIGLPNTTLNTKLT